MRTAQRDCDNEPVTINLLHSDNQQLDLATGARVGSRGPELLI